MSTHGRGRGKCRVSFWAKLFALSLQQRTAQIVICENSGQRLPLLPKVRIMARGIEKVELRGQVDKAVMDLAGLKQDEYGV